MKLRGTATAQAANKKLQRVLHGDPIIYFAPRPCTQRWISLSDKSNASALRRSNMKYVSVSFIAAPDSQCKVKFEVTGGMTWDKLKHRILARSPQSLLTTSDLMLIYEGRELRDQDPVDIDTSSSSRGVWVMVRTKKSHSGAGTISTAAAAATAIAPSLTFTYTRQQNQQSQSITHPLFSTVCSLQKRTHVPEPEGGGDSESASRSIHINGLYALQHILVADVVLAAALISVLPASHVAVSGTPHYALTSSQCLAEKRAAGACKIRRRERERDRQRERGSSSSSSSSRTGMVSRHVVKHRGISSSSTSADECNSMLWHVAVGFAATATATAAATAAAAASPMASPCK